jgi:hypothetical protein
MEEKMKMSETVMLIDASFLNFVIADVKKNFERMLKRELQLIDVSRLITYLSLDADVSEGKNDVQVLFIYDDESAKLEHCQPASLAGELNNVAFSNELGEFSFYSFQPEKIATLQELYLESLKLIAESKEVKKLIILSFNEEYETKVVSALKGVEEMEIIQFRMNEPDKDLAFRWEMLAYPLMQALGIRGDELQ